MEVQVMVNEEVKRNGDICYIYRGSQVIVIEPECNEKSIEDQGIAIAMEEYKADIARIGLIGIISVGLCMFEMVISTPTNAGEPDLPEWLNILLLVSLVSMAQICILRFTLYHPVNKSIFAILCILILPTAISVMEISSASKTAAIIVFISWGILFAIILIVNRQQIYNLCACLNNS
ncbi:unnamed protein product [Lathyrus sativus]|nr:unnamed protein product [Lathyrus sativus]